MFLLIIFPYLHSAANVPTYKYFNLPDGYVEVETKAAIVQKCFEYSRDLVRRFLDDFSGPHPIVLLHAWTKSSEDGSYYACEVLRNKLRYLLIVHIPQDGEMYLHSVRILNSQTPSGTLWSHPPSEILEVAMSGVEAKFGEDAKLRNVAVYKTVMNYHKYAQMVVDVVKGDQRMLIDVRMVQKFGENSMQISSIEKIY